MIFVYDNISIFVTDNKKMIFDRVVRMPLKIIDK